MDLLRLHRLVEDFVTDAIGRPSNITIHTNLTDTSLLDSLSLIKLILFVESILNIEIPIGDFQLDSLSSVSSIYDRYVLCQDEQRLTICIEK